MADDDGPQEFVHDLGEGVQALRTSGLLWALNTNVLHGAGFEARIDGDKLVLAGYGEKVRQWPPGLAGPVDEMWRQYKQTLLDAQKLNNPAHWDGHSPGFARRGGAVPGVTPGVPPR